MKIPTVITVSKESMLTNMTNYREIKETELITAISNNNLSEFYTILKELRAISEFIGKVTQN